MCIHVNVRVYRPNEKIRFQYNTRRTIYTFLALCAMNRTDDVHVVVNCCYRRATAAFFFFCLIRKHFFINYNNIYQRRSEQNRFSNTAISRRYRIQNTLKSPCMCPTRTDVHGARSCSSDLYII